jgi:hypothetical protein
MQEMQRRQADTVSARSVMPITQPDGSIKMSYVGMPQPHTTNPGVWQPIPDRQDGLMGYMGPPTHVTNSPLATPAVPPPPPATNAVAVQTAADPAPVGPDGLKRFPTGGMTRDKMFMTGDARGGNPFEGGAKPEMVVNPTGAPIGVANSSQTRQMLGSNARQAARQRFPMGLGIGRGRGPRPPVSSQPMPQPPAPQQGGGGMNMDPWRAQLQAFIQQAQAQRQAPGYTPETFQQWLAPQRQALMQAHPAYQRAQQMPGFQPPQLPGPHTPPEIPRYAGGTGLFSSLFGRVGSMFGGSGSSYGTIGAPTGGTSGNGLPPVTASPGAVQTVTDTRNNVQVPNLNPFNVGFELTSPTVMDTYYGAMATKYGIPAQDIRAEHQRFRLPGGLASQIGLGY